MVSENYVSVRCAFCKGTGKDPGITSYVSKCVACGGRGKGVIGEPYDTCPNCGGEGRSPGAPVHCKSCRGRGVIALRR